MLIRLLRATMRLRATSRSAAISEQVSITTNLSTAIMEERGLICPCLPEGFPIAYWGPSSPPFVPVPGGFSPQLKSGQTVIISRDHYAALNSVPTVGGSVDWNDFDTLFYFNTLAPGINDGLYELRLVGRRMPPITSPTSALCHFVSMEIRRRRCLCEWTISIPSIRHQPQHIPMGTTRRHVPPPIPRTTFARWNRSVISGRSVRTKVLPACNASPLVTSFT